MVAKWKRSFFVPQRYKMQCGAACLAMICRYYGKKISLNKIDRQCGTSKDGVSMLSISAVADDIGLLNRTIRITPQKLRELPHPCILHWDGSHFVVLYKVSSDGSSFYVADPQRGTRKYDMDELNKHWVSDVANGYGIAMFFQPTDKFCQIADYQEEGHKYAISVIAEYLKQHKHPFALIFVGLLLGCLLQLLMPFITQTIVDVGVKKSSLTYVWILLLGGLMIVIGRSANDFVRRWLVAYISNKINVSLISDFIIKLLRIRISFFDKHVLGDLLQRIEDHRRVQNFCTNDTLSIVFAFLTFVVFGIVLLVYSTTIALIFLCGCVVSIMWVASFVKRRRSVDYDLFECGAMNQDKTYEIISQIQEIKLQDCETRRRWDWEDAQADLFALRLKALKLQQSQEAGSILINEITNIIVTATSASLVISNDISLGAMLAVQFILGQLNFPMSQLLEFIYSFQDVKISLARINEIYCVDNEIDENSAAITDAAPNISFSDVSFKYDIHSLKPTISNISFEIPYGKTIAIVGESGSGKSTIIRMLLGYYKANSGVITVSGENINNINIKMWRKRCGVVMQDGMLFSESIARNIAVADGEIDFNRMTEAAKIANLYDFVMSLPSKFDTIVGPSGIGISQGQKQRILIARAVYKKPDFFFLDEATNSLDAENEQVIVNNLARCYKNRTVVIVAHRLSTIRNADIILVLKEGSIVESGTHNYLISLHSHYYSLVKKQVEGEL